MASDRVGLAGQYLDAAQIETPVNAFVLVHRHGYCLRPMRGPAPAAIGGSVIMFDATAFWRDRHGEVARLFARRILTLRKLNASPGAALMLAKELLLPRATFDHDARCLGFDVEEIGAVHRYAPIEWIDERVRALAQDFRTCRAALVDRQVFSLHHA